MDEIIKIAKTVEIVKLVEVTLPLGTPSPDVNYAIARAIEELILFQEKSSIVTGERQVHYAPLHSVIEGDNIRASRYVTIHLPSP